jgi:hypothetical protein
MNKLKKRASNGGRILMFGTTTTGRGAGKTMPESRTKTVVVSKPALMTKG